VHKKTKSLPPEHILGSKYTKNALAAGTPPKTSLGELTAPAIAGSGEGKYKERKEWKGKERKWGKGRTEK